MITVTLCKAQRRGLNMRNMVLLNFLFPGKDYTGLSKK